MNPRYFIQFSGFAIFIGIQTCKHDRNTNNGMYITYDGYTGSHQHIMFSIMKLSNYRTILKIVTIYNCVDKFEEMCSNTVDQ